MDTEQFDRLIKGLEARLSRRGLNGIAAGALAALGMAADAGAWAQQDSPQRQLASSGNTTCQNVGTACGDTRVCQCRLDKDSAQTCANVVDPPNRIDFRACQTNVNCPVGQICDAAEGVCMTTCDTPAPPMRSTTGNTTCQNLGAPCGNTLICQCRLDKSSEQTCQNVVVPPDGVTFRTCETNADCGADQVCDAAEGLCASTCDN